jgi:hypothetical protein
LHPVIPGSAAQAESGIKSRRMTAEERRKASGPAYLLGRGRARALRRGNWIGAPFGAPPPSLGSKDIASRRFEASFLGKRERKPGCE